MLQINKENKNHFINFELKDLVSKKFNNEFSTHLHSTVYKN